MYCSGDLDGALAVMAHYPSTSPLLYGMVKLLEAAILAGKEDMKGAILEAMHAVGASPEKLATIQLVAYFKADNMEKARDLLKQVHYSACTKGQDTQGMIEIMCTCTWTVVYPHTWCKALYLLPGCCCIISSCPSSPFHLSPPLAPTLHF